MPESGLARVTPHHLDGFDRACPRWLHREHWQQEQTNRTEFHRWDIRNALLNRATRAHGTDREPMAEDFAAPPLLEPEQRALFTRATARYLEYFGQQSGRAINHGLSAATRSPARQVEIGGAVDLLIEDVSGNVELRQFELWGRDLPDDPLDATEIRVAVLRLSRQLAGKKLRVIRIDLFGNRLTERTIDIDAELPGLRAWFDDRLSRLRTAAIEGEPRPGSGCGRCAHLPSCPAHQLHVTQVEVPGVVVLTPTIVNNWTRCRRIYRLKHQLDLPSSDPDRGSTHIGLAVHDLLHRVHASGSCAPAPEPYDPNGGDSPIAADDPGVLGGYLERHRRRCPDGSDALGHELEVARVSPFSTGPWFIVTARIDALWIHDGILDARDYKTGRPTEELVGDALAARVQAFTLAPIARERGLRLRIRHECLAEGVDDDPEPFEPDEEQLDAIAEELHSLATAIRMEQDFTGVGDAAICSRCEYHSICRDSVC